jgi:hypothetical protein
VQSVWDNARFEIGFPTFVTQNKSTSSHQACRAILNLFQLYLAPERFVMARKDSQDGGLLSFAHLALLTKLILWTVEFDQSRARNSQSRLHLTFLIGLSFFNAIFATIGVRRVPSALVCKHLYADRVMAVRSCRLTEKGDTKASLLVGKYIHLRASGLRDLLCVHPKGIATWLIMLGSLSP